MFFRVFPNYLDSSEGDRQGSGNFFFFIFLIFSAVLQQKIPIICTQIDNNYMFEYAWAPAPSSPQKYPNWSDLIMCMIM